MTAPGTTTDILIIDDDPTTGDMLKSILAKKYPAANVHSDFEPAAAVDRFRENLPDILITDFLMPDLNGIQLARKFRELKPATKVIVLSGFSDPSAFRDDESPDSIIDYRIVKPVNFDQLFAAINRCLAGSGTSS